uniref:Uncharacterized protein n=1 Tax=Anguilla anguilla TaxID=7936 RepID=A0A0E9RMW6_ANGAN
MHTRFNLGPKTSYSNSITSMFKAFRKYSPKMKAPLRKTGNLHFSFT